MPYNDWNTDVRNILVAGVAVVAHPFAKGSLIQQSYLVVLILCLGM
jgi:hypothetical protein